MKAAALLALVLLVPMCRGQTFRVSAGHDGLLDANGGYIEAWLPDAWDVLAGYGSSGLGFAARRKFSAGNLVIGDSIISFTTPGLGLIVPMRGAAFEMKNGLTLFAGVQGSAFTSEFFQAQSRFTAFGGGLTYHHDFHGLTLAGSALSAKHKTTAVGSLSEKQKHWTAYLSSGVLQGQHTMNFGATGSLWILNGAASRSTLIADNLSTSFDSASLSARLGAVIIGDNGYESQTTSGNSIWSNVQAGDNTKIRIMCLTAPNQRILDLGILRRLGERISISPGVDRANGAWSWSLGGSFQSNLATLNLSYQMMFLPFSLKTPWEKTLLVSVTLQLRNAKATARSFLEPTGKLKWAMFGDEYATGPLGATREGGATRVPSFEKYIINGTVVTDETGAPVFGACLKIGRNLVFSDSSGQFEIRVKNKTFPLSIELEEFTAPGRWRVVQAPTSATPGEPVRVIVRKL